jgi:hypothetical protein
MKQPPDTPKTPAASVADAPLKPNGKRNRLLTLDALDQRTTAYQTVAKGIQAIEADLGGTAHLSHAERSLIQRCAVLAAMLTDQEAAYLTGAPIDTANYCTMTNALRRTLEAIGLKRASRNVTPDLQTYLASKRTAEAAT